MQLFLSLTSPYARKVRATLLEKGVQFEALNVADGERKASECNPLGKVPTLLLADGTALFDSTVIVEYLDAAYPTPKLIPDAPLQRALVRRWEALADGVCDVLMPVVQQSVRPVELQDKALIDKLEGKVKTSLAQLQQQLDGKAFAFGDGFSLADIAVVCAVGYVNLRRAALLQDYPLLASYVERQLSRSSLASTVPPNLPFRV
jgi:glutathione S-transferase